MVRKLGLTKVDHRLTLTQKPVELLLGDAARRPSSATTKVTGHEDAEGQGPRPCGSTPSCARDRAPTPASTSGWAGTSAPRSATTRTAKVLYVDRTRSGDSSFNPTFAARHTAPLDLHGKPLELTIFVDSSSVEVFAQDGKVSISDLVYPDRSSTGIQLYADGGTARLTRAKIATIGSTVRR